jgi:hypothetical protein
MQHYGDLLADFSKVAATLATARIVLLVAGQPALASLRRNRPQLLPFAVGDRRTVLTADIEALPVTAATRAVGDGPWRPLSAELIWTERCDGWHLLAWQVQPEDESSDAR